MIYRPTDPSPTRTLLAALAVAPDPGVTASWAGELRSLTTTIHATLNRHPDPAFGAPLDEPASLSYETIYQWRSELDRLLAAAEHDNPSLWARARTHGTWLDALLRLRTVLTHVISKAYWSEHTEIRYSDIEIERYLWGAR